MTRPADSRPLSPHLGIYRWQITNTLSILHRITGVGLSLGLALISCWLITAAWRPDLFAALHDAFATLLGKFVLFGWTLAFYYHFANGLRHLNWDAGSGFTLPQVTRTGWAVVLFAILMSLFTWATALEVITL